MVQDTVHATMQRHAAPIVNAPVHVYASVQSYVCHGNAHACAPAAWQPYCHSLFCTCMVALLSRTHAPLNRGQHALVLHGSPIAIHSSTHAW
eukprot:364747-Chlamydomonas_euryale.AAC.12